MAKVTIRYFGELKKITGKIEEAVDVRNPTLGGLLHQLKERYDYDFQTLLTSSSYYIILVNGVFVDPLKRADMKLTNADLIILTPALGGG